MRRMCIIRINSFVQLGVNFFLCFCAYSQSAKEVKKLNDKRKASNKADEVYVNELMTKSILKLENSLKSKYKKTIKIKVNPNLYKTDVYFAENFDENVANPIIESFNQFCEDDGKKCSGTLKAITEIRMYKSALHRNASYKYKKSNKRIELIFSKWGNWRSEHFRNALYKASSQFFEDNANQVLAKKSTTEDIKRLEQSYKEKLINNKTFYTNLLALISGKNKIKRKLAEKVFWRNLKTEKYSVNLDRKDKPNLYKYLMSKALGFSEDDFDLVAARAANDSDESALSFTQHIFKNWSKLKTQVRDHLLVMDWDGEDRYIKDSRTNKYWLVDSCTKNTKCVNELIYNMYNLSTKEYNQVFMLAFEFTNREFTDELKKLDYTTMKVKKQEQILKGLHHVYASGISISSGVEKVLTKNIWKVYKKNKGLQPLYLAVLYAADSKNTEAFFIRQGNELQLDSKFLQKVKEEAPYAAIALAKIVIKSMPENNQSLFYKEIPSIILGFGDNSKNRLMNMKKRAIEAMIEPAAKFGKLNQLQDVLNSWLNENPEFNDAFSYTTRKINQEFLKKKKEKEKVEKKGEKKQTNHANDLGADAFKELKDKWENLSSKLKAKTVERSDISDFIFLPLANKFPFSVFTSYFKKIFNYWGSLTRDLRIELVQDLMQAGLLSKNKEALASIFASVALASGKDNLTKNDNILIWWSWVYSVQANVNSVKDLSPYYRFHYINNGELKVIISKELLSSANKSFQSAWK